MDLARLNFNLALRFPVHRFFSHGNISTNNSLRVRANHHNLIELMTLEASTGGFADFTQW